MLQTIDPPPHAAASAPPAPTTRLSSLLHAAVPLAAFAIVVVAGFRAQVFEYDTDEGLNLMKATLVARGHALYREIWSDQPPLHTLILAGVFRLLGPSAAAARVLTAGFSALLVTSLYDVVRRSISTRAGLIAAGLLLASAWYPTLSFSVMIGLPALALAMASLAVLVHAGEPGRSPAASWALLVSSAVLMSAAVAVKLFAALAIAPGAILAAAQLVDRGERRPVVAGRVCAWLLLILAGCAVVVLLLHPHAVDLVGTHLVASRRRGLSLTVKAQHLMRFDMDLLLLSLAALGTLVVATGRRRASVLVPAVWFGCSAVALQLHEPTWYHHSLLLTVPAAWASAAVIEDLLRLRARWRDEGVLRRGWTRALTLLLAGFFTWQLIKLTTSVGHMFVPHDRPDQGLVEEMRRRASQTTWVVADFLMYPFAAGLVVPPEMAVVSFKRRETGNLSDELVAGVLERYRPEQILLLRMDFGPTVRDRLRQDYRRAREDQPGWLARLYVRRDLPPPAELAP